MEPSPISRRARKHFAVGHSPHPSALPYTRPASHSAHVPGSCSACSMSSFSGASACSCPDLWPLLVPLPGIPFLALSDEKTPPALWKHLVYTCLHLCLRMRARPVSPQHNSPTPPPGRPTGNLWWVERQMLIVTKRQCRPVCGRWAKHFTRAKSLNTPANPVWNQLLSRCMDGETEAGVDGECKAGLVTTPEQ